MKAIQSIIIELENGHQILGMSRGQYIVKTHVGINLNSLSDMKTQYPDFDRIAYYNMKTEIV